MYRRRPGLILGFHGCDELVLTKAIHGELPFFKSENLYDWLGAGMYFWDHSPERAMAFAQEKNARRPDLLAKPAVLGAVIDLGNCLDLIEFESAKFLKTAYELLFESMEKEGKPLPINRNSPGTSDRLLRELDCAVVETIHKLMKSKDQISFDSVRGMFVEGQEVYPGSGIREKDHIQICIRNPNCIKGYFRPRVRDMLHAEV
jgi:hypothetical protein